jgi:PAS domain S-box-containing protein
MILIDLIYNLALLIALSVVSGFVDLRWKRNTRPGMLLQGVVFGGAAVIGMLRPFVFAPGLIFDGRSVMISLGGLFFGPWTAAVACLMTIPLRVVQGGPGAGMGVLVILVSAVIGAGFHCRRQRKLGEESASMLLLFGLVVHLAMLAMTLALPPNMILPVLKRISLPVMLAYPLATVLIGKILSDQATRSGFVESLRESERRFRRLSDAAFEAVAIHKQGILLSANDQYFEMFGYTPDELVGKQALPLTVAPAAREHLMKQVESGGLGPYESIGLRKDGTSFPMEIRAREAEHEGQNIRVGAIRDITERKRAEEALRESEEKHRVLIETTATGFVFLDADGRVLDANDEYLRLAGYDKREQILGRRVTEWTAEYDQARNIGEVKKCIASGAVRGLEVDYVHPDKTVVPIEINASTLGGGDSLKIVALCRDITGRRRAEAALHENQRQLAEANQMLQMVMDTIPVRIFWKNTDLVFLGCNRLFAEDAGQKAPEEILGKTDYEMGWREQAEQYRKDDMVVMRSGSSKLGYEETQTTPDGKRLWLRTSKIPLRDINNHIIGILGTYEDITERKRVEEKIAEANEELRASNRIVSAITGVLNLQEILDLVLNEALGIAELEGGTICLVAPDETLELAAQVGTSEATIRDLTTNQIKVGECLCGECARTRCPLILRNRAEVLEYSTRESTRGENIHFHAAFPLVTARKCVGVLCVFTRTDKKPSEQRLKLLETMTGQVALAIQNARLYEEIHRHTGELEQRVAKRTAELAVAKERAEESDRLKSAFLATMSHELRTPLNSIIGFTGIMLQGLAGPLNGEQAKQLAMVQSSSRHLLALINDVLDISKIEAGQLEIRAERFDLPASLEKVAASVKPLVDKKGLALRVVLSPNVGQAVSDRLRVEQVLLNLLNNAVKFTERGEVTLEAGLIKDYTFPNQGTPQPVACLRVIDTGIGIKPEDMGKIFQPFRQIDSGLTRQHEGTGLGLTICRRLADLLGGEISAKSIWGEGSEFTFTFPLKK